MLQIQEVYHLIGIIKLDNPLAAVQAVLSNGRKNSRIWRFMRNLDTDTWNKWVEFVGKYGAYGDKLQGLEPVTDQKTLISIFNNMPMDMMCVQVETQSQKK